MKFDRSLHLKWIDFNNSALGDFDYNIIDRGVLVSFDEIECKSKKIDASRRNKNLNQHLEAFIPRIFFSNSF